MALLDGLPDLIYNAVNGIGGTSWDMSLKKKAAAVRDQYGGFSQATTTYTCRGLVEDYSEVARQSGGINMTDRKVTLFDSSFSSDVEPAVGDLITAEGTDREIVSVSRDPAGATWTLQVR